MVERPATWPIVVRQNTASTTWPNGIALASSLEPSQPEGLASPSRTCVYPVCFTVMKRMFLSTHSGSARCLNTLYRCTLKGMQTTIFAQTERFSGESRTTSGVTWQTEFIQTRCTISSQSPTHPHHCAAAKTLVPCTLHIPQISGHSLVANAPVLCTNLIPQIFRHCIAAKAAVPGTHLIPPSSGHSIPAKVAVPCTHLIPPSSGHCISAGPCTPHSAGHWITRFITGRCKRSSTRDCSREPCVEERHGGSI